VARVLVVEHRRDDARLLTLEKCDESHGEPPPINENFSQIDLDLFHDARDHTASCPEGGWSERDRMISR
jgi:hypothetical protein